MTTVEDLINTLYKTIAKLEEDLAIAENNVRDFESLAKTWMESYNKEVPALKAKLVEKDQIIEDLEDIFKDYDD